MDHTTDPDLQQLSFLLHTVASRLDKQSDQSLMEQLGVGFSQFKIVQVIAAAQRGIAQRSIAEQLGQTEASVSRQVAVLRQRGLVEIRVSPNDKREHRVWLTHRGTRLYHEAARVVSRVYRPILAKLGDKPSAQLHETLVTLYQGI